MSADIEKNLGEQPIARLMVVSGLKPHDLVSHSDEQLTHKMVTRAMKGRRLTPRAQTKVLNALNNAAEKEIKVNLEISKEKITLMASRIELRRLFFNLIDNAIKFTPQRGSIDISVNRRKNKAQISITDTGIGIKDEDVPKIFNKFFRVSSDEKGEKPSYKSAIE